MTRPNPIDVGLKVIKSTGYHGLAGFVILSLLFPKLAGLLVIAFTMFLLGMIFYEAVVPEGGMALVQKHYNKRLAIYKPPIIDIQMEVDEQLKQALDSFINYIVRDFINSWYNYFNVSKSTEFSDAIHASIYASFVTLGKSISQVNPTDLILAIMKVVIEHVKEYREFDLTGLDIKDYLKQHPQSRFHAIQSREASIDLLREQTMKLSLHVLPRADKSSPAVFGICREIVATTVLLPILDKITDPVWLNETILNAMKATPGEGDQGDLGKVQPLGKEQLSGEAWNQYVKEELAKMKKVVEETTSKIKGGETDQISLLLQQKLEAQKYVEEILEIQGKLREEPISEPIYPIKNARISVIYIAPESSNQIMGALQYITTTNQGKFMVTVKLGDGYVIEKTFKQFQDLFTLIQSTFPRLEKSFPRCLTGNNSYFKSQNVQVGDLESEQFYNWLEKMVQDPVCCLYIPLVQFLQPTKEKVGSPGKQKGLEAFLNSASNMEIKSSVQQALNSAGTAITKLSPTKTDFPKLLGTSSGEETVVSSVISQEDLEVILDVAFTAIEELFSLTNPDQWIRQQSLHLIKVVLKRAYGYQLAQTIATKLESVSTQQSFAEMINGLSNQLWPNGLVWGKGPPPVVHPLHEQERLKHQLFCLLTEQEGVKKNVGKVISSIQQLVGTKNTKSGLLRGFHLVQNKPLNVGLCAEIVKVIVSIITDLK